MNASKLDKLFGYVQPSYKYEAVVKSYIDGETLWLDVGGGTAPFPHNDRLSSELTSACKQFEVLDPSDNIKLNTYASKKHLCSIEDLKPLYKYDLITMRMVAEHVENPDDAFIKVKNLLKPGGVFVIYTVNKYAPITILNKFMPSNLRHKIKKALWNVDEKDTFKALYKMNTRTELSRLSRGMSEHEFYRADDVSLFRKFPPLHFLALCLWRAYRLTSLPFPEHNIIAVYKR